MPSISLIRRKLQGFAGEGEFGPADLQFSLATMSSWKGAFRKIKLGAANFERSRFTNFAFVDCSAQMLSLGGSTFDHVEFTDCDLGGSSFVGAILKNVTFRGCDMQYANFAGATIRSAVFDDCNLHGADLDFIENNRAKFVDCNLWGAKASLGCQFFNSEFDERTCDRFVAMVARLHPNDEKRARLEGLAGRELPVVKRLMDRREPEEGAWPGTEGP